MYPVTNAVRDLFWSGARQVVRITFQGSGGTITLTEADVMQGGLTIDRYSVSGSKIEIGSAVAAELTLKLDNNDGRFNDVVFEGAELYVQIGIRDWTTSGDTINWVPCGYFTVDEPPRTLSIINIKALDRMVRFDRVIDPAQLTFPMTVETLVQRCCALCDVTMVSGLSGLPNRSYSITAYPANSGGELTYRALIQWCAALLGTCAFIRWDGLLTFQWYTATGLSITPAQRYSSDLLEKDIVLTGVTFTDSEDRVYTAGNSRDYALDLTGNGLIQSGPQAVLNALSGVLTGFTYRAYTAEIKSSPFLYPMDKITFTDSDGGTHPGIVTSVTFLMNGTTGIAGAGETGQMNGYASTGALTQQQSVIIKKLINTDITREALAAIQLNETIANSLGLYRTGIVESDGSTTYYFHDAATLADSTIIYTFRAGGFAWTDDWNGGNPVWTYGITRQGNALLNILTVYKLTADYIYGGTLTLGGQGNGNGVLILLNSAGNEIGRMDKDGASFSGNLIMESDVLYAQIGTFTFDVYDTLRHAIVSKTAPGFRIKLKQYNIEYIFAFNENGVRRIINQGSLGGFLPSGDNAWDTQYQYTESGGDVWYIREFHGWYYRLGYYTSGGGENAYFQFGPDAQSFRYVSRGVSGSKLINFLISYSGVTVTCRDQNNVQLDIDIDQAGAVIESGSNSAPYNLSLYPRNGFTASGTHTSDNMSHELINNSALFSAVGSIPNASHELSVKRDEAVISHTESGSYNYNYEFLVNYNGAYVNGNRLAYDTSSSRRYKHSIASVDSDLDPHKLYNLPVKQFVYNDDHPLQYADMKGQTLPGFIAEDVERVYPAAVIHNADGEVESWDERRIIPGMLALIQEQREEISRLQERVSKLERLLLKGED